MKRKIWLKWTYVNIIIGLETMATPPENAIYQSDREDRARHGLGKVYRNSLYVWCNMHTGH